jgi:hypothetical protein
MHSHSMMKGTCLNKGPIEEVTVVGDVNTWLHFSHVREPANEQLFLQISAVQVSQTRTVQILW